MPARARPRGVTLVELLVTLVLLGLLASAGFLSLAAARAPVDPAAAELRRAMRRAVSERRVVALRTDSAWLRVLPDGRVLEAPRLPHPEGTHAP